MNDKDVTIWDCPQCSTGKLVRRGNRKEGTTFLGCSNYPKCQYAQKDEKPDEELPDVASVWER